MDTVYIVNHTTNIYSLVKKIAAQKYNIDISELKIIKGEHGKPYFESLPNFHFNISHSGALTVLAISETPVGIDIEKLRTPDFRVTKRFCPDEQAYIAEADSTNRFFEVWTKKEAVLKYQGCGLTGSLKSFSVLNTPLPLKTVYLDNYIISICGHTDFEIVYI